ncbi:MAG: phosphate/phosphite/phosphonate ABC transporter substrate-binding protein [Gammaproteobacteria bacterium]|nr:phosphate/phosphite/phosphonate ABC transporter substrate-binding protein [Gammaproteobacteria bacterium]MCP5416704.1 phosphate/phosphite/phosphonate ABC transporter substrate-binding protein [Chromatiaceae bacterium]
MINLVMSNLKRWLPIIALSLLLGACQDSPKPPAADQSLTASPSGDTLLLAVHPYDTPSRIESRFRPLCDYLGARLGRPVTLYLAHSYGDQIRRISHGQVDLAYMGPTPYLRAHDHYLKDAATNDLPILAGETLQGVIGFRSVIVALKNGPVRSLNDLRDRTLAFGDHRSFGSHYMPRALLWKAGLTLADLKDYAYLGRHERVALAVVHGDFDAGGLREDVARLYLDRGLRIIAESPLLPPHVIVARPGLAPSVTDALRAALLEPDANAIPAFAALGPGTGFSQVDDLAFQTARETIRAFEAAPPQGITLQ